MSKDFSDYAVAWCLYFGALKNRARDTILGVSLLLIR